MDWRINGAQIFVYKAYRAKPLTKPGETERERERRRAVGRETAREGGR